MFTSIIKNVHRSSARCPRMLRSHHNDPTITNSSNNSIIDSKNDHQSLYKSYDIPPQPIERWCESEPLASPSVDRTVQPHGCTISQKEFFDGIRKIHEEADKERQGQHYY